MKFIDYEASHITPQGTLLKKVNEILKYLRGDNYRPLFLHKISYSSNPLGKIYLVNTNPQNLTNDLEGLVNEFAKALTFKIVNEDTNIMYDILNFQYNSSVAWGYATIIENTTIRQLTILALNNDEVEEL